MALSVIRRRTPAVSRHAALWRPDFPPPFPERLPVRQLHMTIVAFQRHCLYGYTPETRTNPMKFLRYRSFRCILYTKASSVPNFYGGSSRTL